MSRPSPREPPLITATRPSKLMARLRRIRREAAQAAIPAASSGHGRSRRAGGRRTVEASFLDMLEQLLHPLQVFPDLPGRVVTQQLRHRTADPPSRRVVLQLHPDDGSSGFLLEVH